MSTIRLLKNGPRGQKGDTISVPFGVGSELVASGCGEYPPQPESPATKPAKVAPTAADRHAAELTRLNDLHTRTLTELKDDFAEKLKAKDEAHSAEIEKLKAELEAANKTITELQSKKK